MSDVLTNRHVSLKLRLKYFDTMISPVVLFGLASLPFCATPDASRNCWLGSCGWQRLEGHHAQSER